MIWSLSGCGAAGAPGRFPPARGYIRAARGGPAFLYCHAAKPPRRGLSRERSKTSAGGAAPPVVLLRSRLSPLLPASPRFYSSSISSSSTVRDGLRAMLTA